MREREWFTLCCNRLCHYIKGMLLNAIAAIPRENVNPDVDR